MEPRARFSLFSVVLFFFFAVPYMPSYAQENGQQKLLRFAVIITRHGVRAPTGKYDLLNQYSAQNWSRWSVPDAQLTAHGFHLMELMGSYDRALFTREGLFSGTGCDDAARIRIVADSDQRTRETGRALAVGLAPGCTVAVQALPEGTADPLFHPMEAGLVPVDKNLAVAALLGRLGNHPDELAEVYREPLAELDRILSLCPAGRRCPPHSSLFSIDGAVTAGKSDHLVELRSPLTVASTMTENFLLEYAEGRPMQQVGWGLIDAKNLRALLALHVALEDLTARTEPIARAQASNLLAHLLGSVEQAATGRVVAGALTGVEDRLLILSGHDTNLANIAGALHLNWLVDGRRDDTPPGGALLFELWQRADGSQAEVRTYYIAQTLEQMRHASPLSLAVPPERVPVFVPGCRQDDGFCSLADFHRALTWAIDPAAVR